MVKKECVEVNRIVSFLKKKGLLVDVYGDDSISVSGFSSLYKYKKNTVTWAKKQEIADNAIQRVDVCIVNQGINIDARCTIVCSDAKAAFFSLIEYFFTIEEKSDSIGKNTIIGENVVVGKNVCIGNNCSITGKVTIGDGTVISDNVVIKNSVSIGCNCVIQSNTSIGEDGFAYIEDSQGLKTMVKHYGGVFIGDDVFIGCHVNIARGTIDDTIIENGVKIAPSTHIGHNNYIEKNSTIICSQLYGSGHMGENSYIVASVLRNQCCIGDHSMVGMGSVITKDIPQHVVAIGIPAKVIRHRE